MDEVTCPMDPHAYQSVNISKFLEDFNVGVNELENKKYSFSVEYLRILYKKNRKLFANLTVEFALRGCRVNVANGNLFFEPVTGPFHVLISKKIENKLNIPKMIKPIQKFLNIQSNYFFEGIVIENFQQFIPKNYDFRILSNVFTNMGFELVSIVNDSQGFNELVDSNIKDLSDWENVENNELSEIVLDSSLDMPISVVFSNHNVHRFFYSKGIYKYNQITIKGLVEIKHMSGVGVKKWESIVQDLKNLNHLDHNTVDERPNPNNVLESLPDASVDIPIDKIISLPAVLQSFKDNNVTNYNQITTEVLKKVRNTKGMGVKKFNRVILSLKEAKDQAMLFKDREQRNKLRKVYPEILGNKNITRNLFKVAPENLQCVKGEDGIFDVKKHVEKLTNVHVDEIAKDVYQSKEDYFLALFKINSDREEEIDNQFLDSYGFDLEHLEFSKDSWKYSLELGSNSEDEIASELLYVKENLYLPQIIINIKNEILKKYEKKQDCIDILNLRLLKRSPVTLEEIGQKYDLSRERIRQKEKKLEKELIKAIECFNLNIAVESYLNLEENVFIINDSFPESYFCLISIFNGNVSAEKQIYLDKRNIFVSKKFLHEFKEFIGEFQSREMFTDEELFAMYKKYFKNIDKNPQSIEQLVCRLGYFKVGHYFTNTKVTRKEFIYQYVVKKGQISLNQGFLNDLSSSYKRLLGKSFNNHHVKDPIRNVQSQLTRLVEDGRLFLVDSNVYSSTDVVGMFIDDSIDEVKEFIDGRLEKFPEISSKIVYAEFKPKTINCTEGAFYSALKNKLTAYFSFGRNNTKTIRLKNKDKKTSVQVLEEYVELKGGKSSLNEVLHDMGWKKYSTSVAVEESELLVQARGKIFLKEKDISENVIEFMKKEIKLQRKLHPKYVISSKILDDLLIDRPDLSINGGIPSSYLNNVQLFSKILRGVDNSLKGRIILSSSGEVDNEMLLDEKFGNETFSIKEFIEFYNSIGFENETSIRKRKTEMEMQGQLCEIDKNEFILAKYIKVTDDDVDLVENYLDSLFKMNLIYISLDTLAIFNGLPKIDKRFRWNSYIFSYYVSFSKKYKQLFWESRDIKKHSVVPNNSHIIVKANEKFIDLLQLTKEVLKKNYQGSMNEIDVAQYLFDQHILARKRVNYLPMYIKNNLFNINKFGSLEYKND